MPQLPGEPDVEKVVDAVVMKLVESIEAHDGCTWRQVGPCVYCADHQLRLYQGSLPSDRKPPCTEHDWDYESGRGFYYICRICGERDWTE